MAKAVLEASAVVDYPEEGETVVSLQYTFRVNARPGLESVELSVDQGPWHACRPAVGYWWYDWANAEAGEHQARVRVRDRQGRVEVGPPRWFRSEPQED